MTKVPQNWKSFMLNSRNKTQLIELLKTEWRKPDYALRLKGRQIMFVCAKLCDSLSSSDGLTILVEDVPELTSCQGGDTHIILHCLHAAAASDEDTEIIVR